MVRSFFNGTRERIKIKSNKQQQNNITLKVSKSLQTNLDNLRNLLDKPNDLKIREFKFGEENIKCAFAYINGLVDIKTIELSVLNNIQTIANLPKESEQLFTYIQEKFISLIDVQVGTTLDDLSLAILSGSTIFYVDGVDSVLMIDTSGGEMRQVDEPVTETLIRGPRNGFVESLQTNIGMIRRNITDPNLRFKSHFTGRRSKKRLVITYVEGIVNPKLVEEVERRLKTIDMDIVSESGYIEAWIEDSYLSPFPQIINTERPDKVARSLMYGKVAILLDGTPFALIVPISFPDILRSPEDYYERWTVGSLLRILRYAGAFISIFLPAIYIALTALQPGMLPSMLAFSIAGTREGVPFPPVIEALMMVITMELLQEAGVRLPQTIGQTVGIVGGLVIGEAAVQAGIVSPIMVIVVALTAIANFAIPAYSIAITFRIIRFFFIMAAAFFGLYGIVLAYIMVNIHFVNLKSFGVPYTTPFAPFIKADWEDTIIRLPIPMLKERGSYLLPKDDTPVDNKGGKK